MKGQRQLLMFGSRNRRTKWRKERNYAAPVANSWLCHCQTLSFFYILTFDSTPLLRTPNTHTAHHAVSDSVAKMVLFSVESVGLFVDAITITVLNIKKFLWEQFTVKSSDELENSCHSDALQLAGGDVLVHCGM